MVPEHKIARLLDEVHAGGYEVFPGYTGLSLQQAQAGYNEVGPDKWRPWQRKALTTLLPILDVPAFIHDLEATYYNDGTRGGFERWNARFRRNGRRHVQRSIPAWRFLTRRALYAEVQAAYLAVSSGEGWEAWQGAYNRSMEPGPEEVENG